MTEVHYLTRTCVCDRLRISLDQTYRLLGRSRAWGSRISSTDILALLNKSRRGNVQAIDYIPCDIVTADEAEKESFIHGSEITSKDLIRWSRRKRNPLPNYRLNKHTTRFSLEAIRKWLSDRAKLVRS